MSSSLLTNSPDKPQPLTTSRRQQKRAARKKKIAQKREEKLSRLLSENDVGGSVVEPTAVCQGPRMQQSGEGKAARARRARNGETFVGTCDDHRASGGAPVSILPEHTEIVSVLEQQETLARTRARPELVKRKSIPTDNHGSMEATKPSKITTATPGVCSMSECSLRSFSTSQIPTTSHLTSITCLDLSRNELWTLPDLSLLVNVSKLDISRNWFRDLPASISDLLNLESLNASHNMLKSSRASLQIDTLKTLPKLIHLDISFNQKCGRQTLRELLENEIPSLKELKMTINFPPPKGAFVGASAAERDATLLRSQLEPWGTTALRRRLVADFGTEVLPPEEFPRSEVMKRLLQLYEEEEGERTCVQVNGTLVDADIRKELLIALRAWSEGAVGGNQERTSIKAKNYMILASPAEFTVGSKKASKAALKLSLHKTIWDLAQKAMVSVDPAFAKQYTALAVTHGFQGSPHIDRQNLGPFYALALGDFEEGTGGIQVECSARVIATVNTKNRMAKVDGRYPHWVAPYDQEKERHSLIYYRTTGEMEPVGPAVFQAPIV